MANLEDGAPLWTPDPPKPSRGGPGYLNEEFIQGREQYYVERDGRPVWAVCGDEGWVTNSRELIRHAPDALLPREGMHANFGQIPALALTTMAVGLAVHGPEFLEAADSFEGLTQYFIDFMRTDQSDIAVLPAGHSARPQETAAANELAYRRRSSSAFQVIGNAAIGCAYASNIGRVPEAISTNPNVQAVAKSDLAYFFGNSASAPGLIEAHTDLAAMLGPERSIGRQDLVAANIPVMVLGRLGKKDTHFPADQTGVIFNFDPRQVSQTHDHYRVDVAGTALLIRRAMAARFENKYDLPAKTIMEAVVMDSVPVRTLLASHDSSGNHTPDPLRLAVGRRGGGLSAALAAIEELEGRNV
jgi:hypothetical protein